jgi:2-methylcitrate dehydratase PrpD
MTGLTAALGKFLEEVTFKKLPSETIPQVRDAFTDTVAVIMAGVHEPVTEITRRTMAGPPGSDEARICLSGHRTWGPGAALISGTSAHALDFDDQSLTGHPSAVLVPAILAEAETLGANGQVMTTAYVAGYEIWAELIRRNSNYHTKGWHPTSVFGVVGAAAACAVLRGLNAKQASTALAIAASHANGLGSNFGTMTKPLHAGMAASGGVVSARLAAAGLTAGADTLEAPKGFLTAFSPGSKPDYDSEPKVGKEWALPWQRLCVKKYPTCYFMHRSFDTTARMVKARGLKPSDIAGVEVTMGSGQTAVLTNHRPVTGLEAKFSEQFAIAVAVILGRMGLEEVTDEVVARPDIQAFFPKVSMKAVDEYDPRDPAHSPTERVHITLTSGEVLDSGPIRSVRGHAEDPLSTEELWEKMADCTKKTHTPADAKKLFDVLQKVDTLASAESIPTVTGIFGH